MNMKTTLSVGQEIRELRKIAIILSTLVLIASGCRQATKKQIEQSEDTPYSIAGLDSVVFDSETFYKYKGDFNDFENGLLGEKYQQTEYFITEDPDFSSCRFLVDSIPMDNGMYNLIISDWEKEPRGADFRARAYLVNYSADGKYIDSRLIYREGRGSSVYSKLYLPQKKIVIFDNDTYSDEYFEVPTIIHKNGMFEEFPDLPFSKNTFAIGGCTGRGLSGKLPLKQQWTIISLHKNEIRTVETQQVGYDYIGNDCTYFPEIKDIYYFDIAFKGVYDQKDFENVEMKQEENAEIAEIVKQNVPQEIDSLQSEVIGINLFPFVHNEKTFWIAYYTFTFKSENKNEYTALLGVTPEMQVVFLANYCVYENSAFIFRLKDEFLLYTHETSCGEGAFGLSRLYKIDNDFKLIFEEGIGCD